MIFNTISELITSMVPALFLIVLTLWIIIWIITPYKLKHFDYKIIKFTLIATFLATLKIFLDIIINHRPSKSIFFLCIWTIFFGSLIMGTYISTLIHQKLFNKTISKLYFHYIISAIIFLFLFLFNTHKFVIMVINTNSFDWLALIFAIICLILTFFHTNKAIKKKSSIKKN
ncbi:hypothetical protein KAH94_02965 [bacterium]|nr:hypothetical protein [bacterium]